MSTDLAGKIAGLLSFSVLIPYIISMIKGRTKPNRASWIIWTVVGCTLGASYYSSGARHTMWIPVVYVIGPLIISVLSIKYGEGGWTRFDKSCIAGAVMSLVLWLIFSSSLIALIINLIIDILGALPTIRKSYSEPEKENRLAWGLSFAGSIANLFAVERWIFVIAIYPIYMLLGNGTIFTLVIRPRKRKLGK